MKGLLFILLAIVIAAAGCLYIPLPAGTVGVQTPSIDIFDAAPDTLRPGGRAVLNWSVSNARSVTIDNGIGSVALRGSRTILPATTTVYTLTAVNASGTANATVSVFVQGTAPAASTVNPPSIHTFSASPASAQSGGSVVIYWNISGASSAYIDQGVGNVNPISGGKSVTPVATTDYTLTASNAGGSTSRLVTVNIVSAADVPAPGVRTAIIGIVAPESGSLVKSGASYTRYGIVCAGDNAVNLASRAFMSFDLTSLPPTANISEVVLDLSAVTFAGNPSYSNSNWGNMGELEFYNTVYGPFADLGRIAYEAPLPRVGGLKLEGLSDNLWKLDVTLDSNGNNALQQAMSGGQQYIQYRAQFFTSTNWDSRADQVCMEGAVLRVKYTLP